MRTYSLYIFRGEEHVTTSRVRVFSLDVAIEKAFGEFTVWRGSTYMKLLDESGAQVWEWKEPHPRGA